MGSGISRDEARLWMTALGLSLLLNVVILALLGIAALELSQRRKAEPAAEQKPAETVAMIYPEMVERIAEEEAEAEAVKQRFARTSADQAAPKEKKKAAFAGERDTVATSDRAPDRTKPPLPSQAGIEAEDREIETTESRYHDGDLGVRDPASAAEAAVETPVVEDVPPVPAAEPAEFAGEPGKEPGRDAVTSSPRPREKLLEGPNAVDVQVPLDAPPEEKVLPEQAQRAAAATPPKPEVVETPKPPVPPKPEVLEKPAFSGFQRKTAVFGAISRNGRSALDVEDTALGRYQAQISRAVEKEWQRNCVRHRDFITPGFLTVRFFVESGGKVRSVQFVGDMQTGEIQKGFTLNAIRDAEIPAMPDAVRGEYDDEPLELIFRFYF